jgi:hypothetical protein
VSVDNLFISNVLTLKVELSIVRLRLKEFLEMCKIFILNELSLSCLCIKSNVEGDVMWNRGISEQHYQPHFLPLGLKHQRYSNVVR